MTRTSAASTLLCIAVQFASIRCDYLKQCPSTPPAGQELRSLVDTAIEHAQGARYNKAADAFELARCGAPSDGQIAAMSAQALELSHQPDRAIEAYRQAAELNPQMTEISASLARLLAKQGQLEDAESVIYDVYDADGQEPALQAHLLHTLAWTMMLRGQYDMAAEAYSRCAEYEETDDRDFCSIGAPVAQEMLGDIGEAVRLYKHTVGAETRPLSLLRRGILLKKMGRVKQAEKIFTEYVNLSPAHPYHRPPDSNLTEFSERTGLVLGIPHSKPNFISSAECDRLAAMSAFHNSGAEGAIGAPSAATDMDRIFYWATVGSTGKLNATDMSKLVLDDDVTAADLKLLQDVRLRVVEHMQNVASMKYSCSSVRRFNGKLYPKFTTLFQYAEGSKHDVHHDVEDETNRCVSCSIVLNDDFEGGIFNIHDRSPPFEVTTKIKPQRGQLVCWCAEDMHSVELVTQGIRHGWFSFLTCDASAAAQGGSNEPSKDWDGTKEDL